MASLSTSSWTRRKPATHASGCDRCSEGYDWIYVLAGRLRLLLGDRELTLLPGEVAEFDTHVAHWFGSANLEPAEVLALFGPQGERLHVRARPAPS
jgi:quercetin dioxygenase-like cupin family protein